MQIFKNLVGNPALIIFLSGSAPRFVDIGERGLESYQSQLQPGSPELSIAFRSRTDATKDTAIFHSHPP